MLDTVIKTIHKHKMFHSDDTILVGLSGGADSVALLHVLLELQEKLEIHKIYAVHVNHNLRGADAVADENFVRNLCAGLNVDLKIYQADVLGLAKNERIGIEEAGRRLRYFHFNEAQSDFNAQKIALGHNRDDVAETVLMNLCRGAAIRGLCGIPPITGTVTRPLISVSRAEIEKYLQVNGLKHITDTSNLSGEYTRNRVRNSVIPVIEQHVNPNVKKIIARNVEFIRADEDFLEALASDALTDCIINNSLKNMISLDSNKLIKLPESLARRVVRLAISNVIVGSFSNDFSKNLTNISSTHIQAVLELARGHSGKEVHLPGLIAKKEYSRLIITSIVMSNFANMQGFRYPLEIGMEIYISEICKIFTFSNSPPNNENPPDTKNITNAKTPIIYCTKAIECDIIVGKFFLRTRCPGDKIVLGGNGSQVSPVLINAPKKTFTKKLQDYFTDAKIPKNERDLIPLIVHENDNVSEIICVLNKTGRINANYVPKPSGKTLWATLWSDENG